MKAQRAGTDSMQGRVIGIFLLGWLLPMFLMISVSFTYLFSKHFEEQAGNLEKQVEFNSRICVERLNQAIALSRKATADQVLENVWTKYRKGESGYQILYVRGSDYLSAEYRQKEGLMNAVLWWYDNPQKMNSGIFNSSSGGSFQQLQDYWNQDHEAVQDFAKTLDTSVGILKREDRLYLVRNLVDRSFEPMGALILRLNPSYYFGSLEQFWVAEQVTIWLDGQEIVLKGERLDPTRLGLSPETDGMKSEGYHDEADYIKEKERLYIRQHLKEDDYTLSCLVRIDDGLMQGPLYGYRYVFWGMVLSLIPLLAALLKLFKVHITEPLAALHEGLSHIRDGELGYQIAYEPRNKEFQYLKDGVNTMSSRLEHQFNHIYKEELMLKDARIMALQSNINPHFMNNTLEIINWEARMGDNAKVSKMIQSLSILMDAAMDRKRKAEVPLSEEMMYVDAYLYIISERFGKRLVIEKEIDPDTVRIPVPRLILQPVIENAVEHGVKPGGSGRIKIRSRRSGVYLYLETENDGELTELDQERIVRLLSPVYDASGESSGNLGIANVNQRLKILYGEDCGLTIEKEAEHVVTARLTIRIPTPKDPKKDREKDH